MSGHSFKCDEADEARLRRIMASRLGYAMRMRGMDAAGLCEASGIARSTLYRWLSGECVPSIVTVRAAAWALGCSLDFLACAPNRRSGGGPGGFRQANNPVSQ